MKVHVLQHAAFEGLGSIADLLAGSAAEISFTRFYLDDPLPAPEGLDLLIVMGGPMSVNDEVEFAWLKDEKRFIRQTLDKGVAVLGICLGAQLIASATGARVYPNQEREIGWFRVAGTKGGDDSFCFPDLLDVFHWHGETFDLPAGAVRLAGSPACRNQAFQLGKNAIGLQFHLEMTPVTVRAMVENCRHELTDGRYVQSESELLAVETAKYEAAGRIMSDLLAYLVDVRK